MALVSYSDSESSEDEKTPTNTRKPAEKTSSNFVFDKSNPSKIKINLGAELDPTESSNESESQAKRQRTGAAPFNSFNSLLPAPKRNNESDVRSNTKTSAAKKIFNLKTGSEASFSRESDAELRSHYAEPIAASREDERQSPETTKSAPMPSFAKPAKPLQGGSAFLFKPLSVARNQKKKKSTPIDQTVQQPINTQEMVSTSYSGHSGANMGSTKRKINLFSAGVDTAVPVPNDAEAEDEPAIRDILYSTDVAEGTSVQDITPSLTEEQPQSLGAIASDLNLTAAQRRQLFGRSGQKGASAVNVVNFNTDAEYAANQALIASGETIQHNPVRAIAPGKHSLRQLVNAASVQKEALEESFAEGRRNKREAGNKYGW